MTTPKCELTPLGQLTKSLANDRRPRSGSNEPGGRKRSYSTSVMAKEQVFGMHGGLAEPMTARMPLAQAKLSYDERFVTMYQAYYTRIFAFVHGQAADRDLAKDLAAEVFEKAYMKGSSVRQPTAYVSWLFAIARNVVASYYRKRAKELNAMELASGALSTSADTVEPIEEATRKEEVAHLISQFRTLRSRDQELLSLKFDAELTYADIAKAMGMSEVATRVSIYRALQRLRQRVRRAAQDCSAPAPTTEDGSSSISRSKGSIRQIGRGSCVPC